MTDNPLNEILPPQSYCFCDLAPLYAMNMLTDEEQQWVEQQVADCPELAAELAEYQLAVTMIPYGVEECAPLAGDVKNRLFDRLGLDLDPVTSVATQPAEIPLPNFGSFFTVRSQDLQWMPHPVPCVKIAILHTDETRREQVGLLEAAPGMVYPQHQHGGVEEIYMLSGDLELEGITYYAGDYIRSTTGSTHGVARSVTGCMFFFHASMDDKYSEIGENPEWGCN